LNTSVSDYLAVTTEPPRIANLTDCLPDLAEVIKVPDPQPRYDVQPMAIEARVAVEL
jgi:hypothetical protein